MTSTARRTLIAILGGGTLIAAADIVAAHFVYEAPIGKVLQSVASGALGRAAAFGGGTQTMITGALLHTGIMWAILAVLILAARRVPALVARPWVGGPVYGLVVFGIMNAVVVPLSNAAARTTPPKMITIEGLLIHLVLIGLPMALLARWTLKGARPA